MLVALQRCIVRIAYSRSTLSLFVPWSLLICCIVVVARVTTLTLKGPAAVVLSLLLSWSTLLPPLTCVSPHYEYA